MFALFLILVSCGAQAQEGVTSVPEVSHAESEGPWSLGLKLEVPQLQFSLSQHQSKDVEFEPNDSVNWGVAAGYKGYTFDLLVPVPDSESSGRKGRTQHLDFMVGHSWRKFGTDAFYQSYSGFYSGNSIRSDLHSSIYGLNMYYYAGGENPLYTRFKSGGSFVTLLSLNEFNMGAEEPLLPSDGLLSAKLRAVNIGGGYTYQWTQDNHLLAGQFLMGVGPQWQTLQRLDGVTSQAKMNEQISLSGGYAYQMDEWRTGFDMKFNIFQADLGQSEGLTTTSFVVSIFGTRSF